MADNESEEFSLLEEPSTFSTLFQEKSHEESHRENREN